MKPQNCEQIEVRIAGWSDGTKDVIVFTPEAFARTGHISGGISARIKYGLGKQEWTGSWVADRADMVRLARAILAAEPTNA